MKFEQQENTGSLFVNRNKETDKQPDYTGSVNVCGTLYRLAGWKRKGKKGTFLSLAISDYQSQNSRNQKQNQDEDIPF